jgi:hypothetical protein
MPKPVKTLTELSNMITASVRQTPGCVGFKSVSLYIIVDESAKGAFNWTTASANYGEAGPMLCDEALRRVVAQLQRQYDAIEG